MSSYAPIWVTLAAGIGSGACGAGLGAWQSRKLMPSTKRQLNADAERSESEAVRAAMDTVEEALSVARGRIDNLQTQVTALTSQIGELREALKTATSERGRIDEMLNIALTERAKLQQQMIDINRRLGARRVADLASVPDAIVMVELGSGEIVYANDGIYPLLGYVPSQLVGEPLGKLIPDDLRGRHRELRGEYAKHPIQREMGKGLPLFARPNGGGQIPVDISLHPTGDGRVIALIKRRIDPSHDADPEPDIVTKTLDDAEASPPANGVPQPSQ